MATFEFSKFAGILSAAFSQNYLLEFERIARRHKKAFPIDQCKEIEENNRKGKTRDLFKKIGNNKGKCHTRMGTVKGTVKT